MRLTVSAKVNTLLSAMIVTSLTIAVVLASELFTADLAGSLRKNSLDLATILASRIRTQFEGLVEQSRALATVRRTRSTNYRVQLHGVAPSPARDRALNLDLRKPKKGDFALSVAEVSPGVRGAQFAYPLSHRFDEVVWVDFEWSKITDLFGELTAYSNLLVDADGKILATSDPVDLPIGSSVYKKPEGTGTRSSGQFEYVDGRGTRQLASFRDVGLAGLRVASLVSLSKVEAATQALHRRILLLGAALIFFAMSFGLVFSRGLTAPIRRLAKAAESVRNGELNVHLQTRDSGDEIERFAEVFNRMTEGLREREKLKATFVKFHNKNAVAQLLSGEIKLGGQRRNAVVLFSDLRGFSTLSESMKPEELVSLLNRHLSRMVRVIHEHGGIVDKFVGDAILAVWGLEGFDGSEPLKAVNACLAMRESLNEFNQELKSEGQSPIQMGLGLHQGIVVAGNIGSEERMEYTVMGDTVNTAARIESLTKEVGTDLLVSQTVFDSVANDYVFKPLEPRPLKGKAGLVILYQVIGVQHHRRAA